VKHDFLDRYSRLASPVHRLPAAFKLAATLSIVVAVLLVPPSRPDVLAAFLVALLAVSALSRIPARYLATRVLMLEPFVIGVALLALFQPGGGRVFLFLVARSTLCLLALVLLSNSTPFSELLRVLRRVRVPALLVTTLSLMYRYLFVLVDEAQRMKRARASRTFARRHRSVWHSASTVVSQLFVRSSERAERIYSAMCARGWR
jgi:cobalt/nickel transport system permease protein